MDSHKTVSTNGHNLSGASERRAEAVSGTEIPASAYQPNAALPLGQTGSHSSGDSVVIDIIVSLSISPPPPPPPSSSLIRREVSVDMFNLALERLHHITHFTVCSFI